MNLASNIECNRPWRNQLQKIGVGIEESKRAIHSSAIIMSQHLLSEICFTSAEFGMPAYTDNVITNTGSIYCSFHISAFVTNILFCPCTFSPSFHTLNVAWVSVICQIWVKSPHVRCKEDGRVNFQPFRHLEWVGNLCQSPR